MLAESATRDFAVSLVASLLLGKLCLIGTVNNLSLMDNKPRVNAMTVAMGAAICVSPDQPRVIVAGNGIAALITVGGKKSVFRDSEIFADSPKKLIMFDLKKGISDTVQFAESILDFHLNFNHLV
jgi:hypothetical protein